MASLPVIVGFGGINAAGRSSFHHAYRRMIADKLDLTTLSETYTALATQMNLLAYDGGFKLPDGSAVNIESWLAENRPYLDQHTLVRRLEENLFNPQAIPYHIASHVKPRGGDDLSFSIRQRHVPKVLPDNWRVEEGEGDQVNVTVAGGLDILLPDQRVSLVNSAGQLPSGFDPSKLYASRNHPRGLQLTVYGASDAVRSLGIDWELVRSHVSPDQISVYANSSMGQLDENGNGGLLQSHLKGKRVTSKQLPLGFTEMPADFVNAYVLGSIGRTGANVGACATFLYNLRHGLEDIRSGRKRVAVVGAAEAPITAEVIEGYRTMGALAQDEELRVLDPGAAEADYRRACRPFSTNCGFTLAEGAQFVVLFDDALAVELGANIYGAVNDVFVNADGYKKSISSPGVGNYVTMAKAVAATRSIIGEQALNRTFVQAHGTSTPQNRVTESHILDEVAKAFGISHWPITAVKNYVGHSLAVAAGDQLATTLGVWRYGYIPGIKTIDHIADDVHHDHLEILMDHKDVGAEGIDAAILNSKGFGGNNASASVLAPHVVSQMLAKKHGAAAMKAHAARNEGVSDAAAQYDQEATKGVSSLIYRFGEDVKDAKDVTLSANELRIAGYDHRISLDLESPYKDMI